ncbi:class I adenylate-forming enzyme family protein [Noviherbaspirillum pedocola]|uniref:AMP-binding protein n=1 Tax=Noviherbaspirillum pedocola TaxID=2801341 RepID=A0A934SPJ0_9BURK|nr:AMP-binding protein [Noviherbaspirillum pedocola]MBK4733099.1 AMP-binding protein [Noviherbaspirillum pedocola]
MAIGVGALAPRRIHEAMTPWSASHPQQIALCDEFHRISYGDLPQAVETVAERMAASGVRAGDRVLLIAENCVALALAILAASRLDAWSATVNARLSAREIDNFLAHSGARRAIYFGAASPAAAAHGQARGAIREDWPVIGDVLLGPSNPDAVPEPVFDGAAEQVAVLVYTSGTTGAPKAVMLTHANLLFIANNNRNLRRLAPGDTVYGVLPLSHVYGLSALLAASLISGAALRLVPRFSESALAQALASGEVSVMHGAPAMYAKLLAYCEANGIEPSAPRLRVAQSGGAPLTAALKADFEAAFGTPLHNGYGMTEASPSICQTRMEAPRADCSVGTPIPGIEVRLHGAEGSAEGVGEIRVRGPNVMKGYYRAADASAEAVTADGWLCTGDLARIDADGAFHVVGRSKELIIRSGFNVYPVEVEGVLNAHPGIVQSAVVGRTVEGNEEVVAFIEVARDAPPAEAELRAYLREHLSPYKLPSEIVVLEQLPAAATGKILKKELQRMAARGD